MKPTLRNVLALLIALVVLGFVFATGVATIAQSVGTLAAIGFVLALFTLPSLFERGVFGAYPNKLIIEGLRDTYMADPNGSALGAWLRCKLVNSSTTPDGTPVLQLASATERGSVVTLSPLAAGAYGACALSNGSGGSLMGVCVGTIANGGNVYAAANGKVSAASGGGALLLGVATCAGADGGTVTYIPNPAAA
jgi:hypothetical protein